MQNRSPRTRILIADDHRLFREGLCFILDQPGDIEVIGQCSNGFQALEKVRALKPDIVLLDISMPGLSGIDISKQIKTISPKTRIIILTMHSGARYVQKALTDGSDGYVLKDAASEELYAAIRTVARGEAYLSPKISRDLIDQYTGKASRPYGSDPKFESLTKREREVLQLVSQDLTTRQVAELLCISRRTVENHKHNIMEKLGVHSTTGLVKYSIQRGLVEPD